MKCACCHRRQSLQTFELCNLSPEWNVNVELEIDYRNFMTTLESEMIAKKWRLLTDNGKEQDFGIAIFEKLFMYSPETLRYFFPKQDKELGKPHEWQKYPLFISHVRRVMNGIDLIITLLHHPHDLASYLNHLKEVHERLPGMKKLYVEIFVKSLEDTVASKLENMYTPEYKKAFRKLLTKVYLIMSQHLTN